MGATFTAVKVWVPGETLTAADLNAERDNILNNLTPGGVDDESTDVTAMQATADPYSGGAASLPTSLQGEIQRLRYLVAQLTRQTYWYVDPDFNLLGRKNAIINGACLVNQRITAHALVKDTYGICVDRFYGMATGTLVSAGTLTRITSSTAGRTGYALHFSGITLTGTGVLYLRHRIEAKNSLKFKSQTASFSCKVYHDVGSAVNFTVYIRKANAADNFAAVTAISNNTAQSIANATVTTVKYEGIAMGDCSNGIEIEIKVEPGAITTKNFHFAELQFELGETISDFDYPKSYEDELQECQRYFEKSYTDTVAPGTVDANCYKGFGKDTSYFYYSTIDFKVRKRAAPTLTRYNPATGTSSEIRNLTDGTNDGTTTTDILTDRIFNLINGGGGLHAGDLYGWHWTASAEL